MISVPDTSAIARVAVAPSGDRGIDHQRDDQQRHRQAQRVSRVASRGCLPALSWSEDAAMNAA